MKRTQFIGTAAAVVAAPALSEQNAAIASDAAPTKATFPISAQPWTTPVEGIEVNPWVAITPDNMAVVRVNAIELGQGTFTSNAMMICEELEGDWAGIRAVYADTNRHMRNKLLYDHLVTGSSSSVRSGRVLYQKVGADARERLRMAAAAQWGVPVGEVSAKSSALVHTPTSRRLTYAQVAAAAAKVQLPAEPAIKTADQYTLVGKRLPKMLDTELKVYGLATYGIDVRLPNMVYASIKQSPAYGGKLKSYNFDAIKSRRGVLAAVPIDVNAVGGDIGFSDGIPDAGGIAVVADSWWRAKTALDAMPVTWEASPAESVGSQALLDGFTAKLQEPGLVAADNGNVDTALRGAPKVVEATYHGPYQAHAPMEPMNCTARVTADKVEVWAPTQCPEWAATVASKVAAVPIDKVYVYPTFVGGSFGRRYIQDFVAQAVAVAKTQNGRPVKLLWSREEDIRRNNCFHPSEAFIGRAALGADGMPTAALIRKAGDVYGGKMLVGPRNVNMRKTIRGLDTIPYAIPNLRVEQHELKSPFPTSWLRGTSSIWSLFFLESFVDELANAAGVDPYQYRRKLLEASPPEAFDTKTKAQWIGVLDAAAKSAGWGTPLPKGVGRGIAVDDRHDIPSRKLGNVPAAVVATIAVTGEGAVEVRAVDVAIDVGNAAINPSAVEHNLRGQIAWAMSLGMRQELVFKDGRAVQGNFNDYPVVRMADYPKQVRIQLIKSDHWIYGIGEEIVSQVMPAICNAVHAATGTRVRSLPLRKVTTA
jgi:isoquinoline 1-oxidoreductase beta subunit